MVPLETARRRLMGSMGLPPGAVMQIALTVDCTEHLDLRWVAVAEAGAEPVVSPESIDVAWWPVAALPPDTDASIRALVSALP